MLFCLACLALGAFECVAITIISSTAKDTLPTCNTVLVLSSRQMVSTVAIVAPLWSSLEFDCHYYIAVAWILGHLCKHANFHDS